MDLVYDFPPVWAFVHNRMPGLARADGMRAIGQATGGEVVAGAVFEGINRHHCWLHMAIKPGALVGRNFVAGVFLYAFDLLGCSRVRGYVEASNEASRSICERLGFSIDAKLEGAAQDGGDVIVYAMRRSECRFLRS